MKAKWIVIGAVLGVAALAAWTILTLPPTDPDRAASTAAPKQGPSAAQLLRTFERNVAEQKFGAAKTVGTTLQRRFPDSAEAKQIAPTLASLDQMAAAAAEAKAAARRAEILKSADDALRLQGERKQKADSALSELVAKHDEFSGLTIYTSPDAPIGSVRNYFGVYLVTQPDDAPRVVWRFMTTGPDWLFAKRVWINRDGTVLPPIELPVSDMNRDNTHEKTWEWYEDVLTTDQEIATMMGLATGQKVLLRIEGEQYVRTRELDAREKRAIIQVLNVYAKLLMVSRS